MTNEEFRKLGIGDIVKSFISDEIYIVTGNYGSHVTAVATKDLSHPSEWSLVSKVSERRWREVDESKK